RRAGCWSTWSRSTPATTATPTCCGRGSTAPSGNEAGLPVVDADLALALRLADTADEISFARFRAADLRVTRKPDRTPVTDADTAVEDALRRRIAAERPDDAVLGEERGGVVSEAERGWVIDPIDGTKNFSRGVPVWATLIALTVRGEPVVGVASAPALGRRWRGSRAGRAGAGVAGRRPARARGRPTRAVPAASASPASPTWPTPTCPPPTSRRSPSWAAATTSCGSSTPAGRPGRSATSGCTAWWPRG